MKREVAAPLVAASIAWSGRSQPTTYNALAGLGSRKDGPRLQALEG
jgi:hypothetical protein